MAAAMVLPRPFAFRPLFALILLALCAFAAFPAAAQTATAQVQTSWRLLDYIAVDYREAVQGGRIVNQAEYQEMAEFSASVSERLATLPDNPARAGLINDAAGLQKTIAAKAEPAAVAKAAKSLAANGCCRSNSQAFSSFLQPSSSCCCCFRCRFAGWVPAAIRRA